jgi:nucleoid-associated protein EbfC
MFGNNMLEKLQQMQQQVEASKSKLETIIVTGEAGGNLVHVELTGNRTLRRVLINADLASMEKEDLEDLLVVAFNRALEQANTVHEQEMASSAKGIIPGL